MFVAPSNKACFVAIRPVDTQFDLVDPMRGNCFFAQGKRHKGPWGVFVDGVDFGLHSSLPLGIGVGLVKVRVSISSSGGGIGLVGCASVHEQLILEGGVEIGEHGLIGEGGS